MDVKDFFWLGLPLVAEGFVSILQQDGQRSWRQRSFHLVILVMTSAAVLSCEGFANLGKTRDVMAYFALAASGILLLAALHESLIRKQLLLVMTALTSIFAVAALFGNGDDLVHAAFAMTQCTYVVADHLLAELESKTASSLQRGHIYGIAEYFPKTAGLILVAFLALGGAPGSLFFLVEDIVLEHALGHGLGYVFGMLAIMMLAAIVCYSSFVAVFYGHDPRLEELAHRHGEPNLWPSRLILGMVLLLGLVPTLVGA